MVFIVAILLAFLIHILFFTTRLKSEPDRMFFNYVPNISVGDWSVSGYSNLEKLPDSCLAKFDMGNDNFLLLVQNLKDSEDFVLILSNDIIQTLPLNGQTTVLVSIDYAYKNIQAEKRRYYITGEMIDNTAMVFRKTPAADDASFVDTFLYNAKRANWMAISFFNERIVIDMSKTDNLMKIMPQCIEYYFKNDLGKNKKQQSL